MADNRVKLNELGNKVLLKGLAKKEETLVKGGGKSFLKNRDIHSKDWVPSFDDIENVTELEKHIDRSGIKIGRESLDKILQRGSKAGQPVWKEKLENLFNFVFGPNPKDNPFNDTCLDHSIHEEIENRDGEPVGNISPATKKAINNEEKGKVTPQFPENMPFEMRIIINEKLQESFIGRKFVFDEFQLFRQKNRNGYFTIIANPGMGKSTIAAQYVMEQSVTDDVGCVAFFIVSGGSDRPEACIQSICEQLKLTYKLNVDISRIAKGQDGITSVFLEVLQEISDRHLISQKLVIVIDALDELASQGNDRGNICYLPRYLPENIYFLLTRRNFTAEEERLRTDAGKQNFRLGSEDNMEQCEADACEYIEYQLNNERYGSNLRDRIREWNISEADFVEELQKKSQANFMYLRYVIPAITEGIYKDISLSGIANGLREYYEDHWRIMNVAEGFGLSVIAVFIIQEKDTSIKFISEVLEITVEQVKVIVNKCIQFLDSKALSSNFNILIDQDMRYSFYHKDYRDFLQEEKINSSILTRIRNVLIADNESYGLEEFFDD